MSDRDWDRELADLDRRLAAVPDAPATPARHPREGGDGAAALPPGTLVTPDTGVAIPPPKSAGAAVRTDARTEGRSLGARVPRERRSWRAQLALLFRVVLGVAAVAALVYWPYPATCGTGLGYYLALVAVLGVVGLATSTAAWRHRAAFVHLLGLAMLTGAVVLGAREVLPKVGYAVPSLAHPAAWTCATT